MSSDPVPLCIRSIKNPFWLSEQHNLCIRKNKKLLMVAFLVLLVAIILRLWSIQPQFYSDSYGIKASVGMPQENLFSFEGYAGESESDAILSAEMNGDKKFEAKIYEIVGETPIRAMVPYIAKRDQKVAAFLVGIAKKESSWGEHVPTQNEMDCFNYWGYKGSASRGSAMGYACFANEKEAVQIVGNRIEELVKNKDKTTASKMLVWKCGSSCAGHSPEGVRSWVATVALYLDKIIG